MMGPILGAQEARLHEITGAIRKGKPLLARRSFFISEASVQP
jgi:hypothetical protein